MSENLRFGELDSLIKSCYLTHGLPYDLLAVNEAITNLRHFISNVVSGSGKGHEVTLNALTSEYPNVKRLELIIDDYVSCLNGNSGNVKKVLTEYVIKKIS